MLQNYSYYSLLNGTIPVAELPAEAKKRGYTALALTDYNNMYGHVRFAKAAGAEGIKPVFGAFIDEPGRCDINAVFLARNYEGYGDLCRIITSRKLKDDFSIAEVLGQDLSNMFVVTSSIRLLELLKEKELLDCGIYAGLISTKSLRQSTRRLYEFCQHNNVKFAACHPAVFLEKEDYLLHKTLTAIRLNSTIEKLKTGDLADEEFYFKNSADMDSLWRALPEALKNRDYIIDNCNVDLNIGQYKFPVFPMPEGETSFSFLWKKCFSGLEERYKTVTKAAVDRLQYELSVIEKLNFCDYFLIVWDIVRQARSRGILSIGRGSAANSLAAYCLGLSQVDPIANDFYFERFLNMGRTSPPDVDLDFSWKERDEVVRYVFEKYGYSNVAMISTTVTFKARSAFRETAKVFGIPDNEISKITKLIPWTSARNLKDIQKKYPESSSLNFENEPWCGIVNVASRLADYPRYLSIHPSGIVVAPGRITDFMALEYAKNKGLGLIITQPDMYSVEDMGLVKIDLLSQRSLGVLRDTLGSIRNNSLLKMPGKNT